MVMSISLIVLGLKILIDYERVQKHKKKTKFDFDWLISVYRQNFFSFGLPNRH